MNEQQVISKLESSKIFKEFRKEKPDYYLTHIFTMFDNDKQGPWQVGYYNKEKDRIVVFDVTDTILQHDEEEVFKKGKFVKKLDIANVIPFEEALAKTEEFRIKTYPGELVSQKIIILQNIHEGIVWNITMISMQLNMLNIKLKASDGQILQHTLDPLLKLGKDKV
jgi:hypothetical protein